MAAAAGAAGVAAGVDGAAEVPEELVAADPPPVGVDDPGAAEGFVFAGASAGVVAPGAAAGRAGKLTFSMPTPLFLFAMT